MQHIKDVPPKELITGFTGHYVHGKDMTLGYVEINEDLDAVIFISPYYFGFGELLKEFEGLIELVIILQVEVGADQVVQSFDVVCSFHFYHHGFFVEKVHPFLRVAVIHQVVL